MAMTTMNVDAAIARLAEIRRLLSELPADAFDQRSALEQERFEIQEQLGPIDLDAGRSTEDLLSELASQRTRLHQLEGLRMNVAAQQGGGGYGSAGGADGWGAMQLSLSMDEANDIRGVQDRIGRLKMLLAERGVEDPAAVIPVAPERQTGRWVVLAVVLAVAVAVVLYILRPIPFPASSSDLSWASSPLGDGSNVVAVVSQGSLLHAVGTMVAEGGAESAVVWSSSDGSTWTPETLPNGDGASVSSISAYGRGLMAVGAGSNGVPIVWTFDGTQWAVAEYHEPPSITDRSQLRMAAAAPLGFGVVVVGSDHVGSTSSAAAWFVPDTPFGATSSGDTLSQVVRGDAFGGEGDQAMLGVAASDNGVIGVGTDIAVEGDSNGAIWFSSSGTLWKRVSSDTFGGTGDQAINAVTWFPSGAVAVGTDRSDAAVWYSTDGLTWTRVTGTDGVFDGGTMTAVTSYGNGVVAVGTVGSTPAAWYSPDGLAWIRTPAGEFSGDTLTAITQVGRKLVAVGGADTWIGK
jgi:hypothetical protein